MATYWSDMYDKPTCVYRLYSQDDVLVYVGVSKNPKQRWLAHKRKAWWTFVRKAHITWYEDRQSALDAERHAIFHEDPVFNVSRSMECC